MIYGGAVQAKRKLKGIEFGAGGGKPKGPSKGVYLKVTRFTAFHF